MDFNRSFFYNFEEGNLAMKKLYMLLFVGVLTAVVVGCGQPSGTGAGSSSDSGDSPATATDDHAKTDDAAANDAKAPADDTAAPAAKDDASDKAAK